MRFDIKFIKRSAVALAFGVFLLLGSGATANAQSHGRMHHQSQGGYYYPNSHAGQGHRYQGHNRSGRQNYNYGYSPYYGNPGYYGNQGYYNGYGNYYGHRDSRNRVKRFFHHALGGH